MPLEENPGTQDQVGLLFSNDAATKLEVVSPSNPLPVTGSVSVSGGATAANQPSNVTQGSSTVGQTGTLVMGAVDSNPPSITFYTSGTTQPFVMDTDGNLKVEQPNWTGSGVINTGSLTATFNTNTISGLTAAEYPIGAVVLFTNPGLPSGLAQNTPYVIVTSSSTVAQVATPNAPNTPLAFVGSGVTNTATHGFIFPVSDGMGSMGMSARFSGGGVLSFLSSPDGIVWATRAFLTPSTGVLTTTMSATSDVRMNIGGSHFVVAYVSVPASSQTISFTYNQSAASTLTALTSPLPNGTNSIGAVTNTSQAPVAPGTATATTSTVIGGQYNSAGVTLTTGQQSSAQLDVNGRLLATLASAGPVAPGAAAIKSNLSGGVYTAAGVTLTDTQQVADQVDIRGNQLVTAGGKTVSITVTPTVTASNAYGVNYVVGGLLTFANAYTAAGTGILQGVVVTINKVETSGFTFFPFSANPNSTTWTDAAVAAINAADVAKVRGPISLSFNSQLGVHTILYADALAQPMAPGATSLYGVLVANAALTNQFTSASDVTVTVKILQDL